MITEHGKQPAYISTGSRGWEKAPRWFIEYKATICHIAALSYKVVVPNYRDIAEMNNKGVVKRRYIYRERDNTESRYGMCLISCSPGNTTERKRWW